MKIVIVILALALVGGGAWWLMRDQTDPTHQPTSTDPSTTTEANSDDSDQVRSGEVAIQIQDFAFNPRRIKIKKGTKVTWTNQDQVEHTVTSDNASSEVFDSELMATGATFSFTFDTTGTFGYHCQPDPTIIASVEVVD